MKNKKQGMVIAIVGPHYSGKSTLSKKLSSEKSFIAIKENWVEDPFRNFRENGDYLKSQIWFLTETMKNMLKAIELKKTGKKVILDTFVNTTRSFCRSKLSTKDFEIFEIIFKKLNTNFPQPDLLIYITGPVDLIMKRAKLRAEEKTGPASDKSVTKEWVKKSINANKVEFENWSKTPMIKIDISMTDIANNEDDYKNLLKEINHIL